VMRDVTQRAVLSIIDGIVAGEGNGPLAPKPKRCGVLVGGRDSWACDYVATTLMGVDPAGIGFLSDAARAMPYPITRLTPEMLRIVPSEEMRVRFDFDLPLGWRNVRAPSPLATGPSAQLAPRGGAVQR